MLYREVGVRPVAASKMRRRCRQAKKPVIVSLYDFAADVYGLMAAMTFRRKSADSPPRAT